MVFLERGWFYQIAQLRYHPILYADKSFAYLLPKGPQQLTDIVAVVN